MARRESRADIAQAKAVARSNALALGTHDEPPPKVLPHLVPLAPTNQGARASLAFPRPLSSGMADEQAETFIAKGRTLTLEEFEYAPES